MCTKNCQKGKLIWHSSKVYRSEERLENEKKDFMYPTYIYF